MAKKHKDYLSNYGSRVITTKGPLSQEDALSFIHKYFLIFRETPDYIRYYYDDSSKMTIKSVLAYMLDVKPDE